MRPNPQFHIFIFWSHSLKKSLMENFIFCAVFSEWFKFMIQLRTYGNNRNVNIDKWLTCICPSYSFFTTSVPLFRIYPHLFFWLGHFLFGLFLLVRLWSAMVINASTSYICVKIQGLSPMSFHWTVS